jgi:hypothetical protein
MHFSWIITAAAAIFASVFAIFSFRRRRMPLRRHFSMPFGSWLTLSPCHAFAMPDDFTPPLAFHHFTIFDG